MASEPEPSPEIEAMLAALKPEEPGDRIGSYRLIEKLGEGGFGVVWSAEQEAPIQRVVAVKIIKVGMDTREVIARFEQERQALAMMDHPNIAKVFDAGATKFGRPFFVMELVTGTPITEFCDHHRLSVEQRLELFVQACQAIQHAHQKGVIHRDIKPSNVLVGWNDGVPVPKVIDFGLAKAMQQGLTAASIHTMAEQMIGTPTYMSPEQAGFGAGDVDTRTDIYSLGMVLYELLAGRMPIPHEQLEKLGYDEMWRTIREDEPPRPSTVLRGVPEGELRAIAQLRQTEAEPLIRAVRGDLDWIVMKALEKDRARRYATASDFAADILRWRASEPVSARPPHPLYVTRRFVRRHKVIVGAVSAVAVSLIAGFALTLWQFVERTKAYQIAREAQIGEADLRRRAEVEELAARRRAYASDMNLAQEALAANNLGRARAILDSYWPRGSERDFRNWEWRYLWQQCQSNALFALRERGDPVFSLAVSADGKWLAVGDGSGEVGIWDVEARRTRDRLPKLSDAALAVFSPVEPLLAFAASQISQSPAPLVPPAGEQSPQVRFWDVAERRVIRELPIDGSCRGLVFSADGQRLLTATDRELAIWRVADGMKIASHLVSDLARTRVTVKASFDLSVAAYAISEGRLRVVDLATGKVRWTVHAADENVMRLEFSPDGTLLASAGGFVESAIRLWDVATGAPVERLTGHRTWVSSLVFWPDGKTLASASADQTIILWDLSAMRSGHSRLPRRRSGVAESRRIATLRGHNLEVWALALLPDNRTLVSGAKDGAVYGWDTQQTHTERARVCLPENVTAWQFTQDARTLLTLNKAGEVSRLSGATFQKKEPAFSAKAGLVRPVFSGDGNLLAAQNGRAVEVWDLQKQALVRRIEARDSPIFPVAFVAPSQRLITHRLPGNTLHEWDIATGGEIRAWRAGPELRGQFVNALSPDAGWSLVVDPGGTGYLANARTAEIRELPIGVKDCSGAAFTPDGRHFTVVSSLGSGSVWETASGRQVAALRGFLLGMHSAASSPDGKRVAIGGDGREAIKLWGIESLTELMTLEGEGSMFQAAAFSPDGSILAATNEEGTLHIWRAPRIQEIEKLATGR